MFNIEQIKRTHELERRNNEQRLASALSKAKYENQQNTLSLGISLIANQAVINTQIALLTALRDEHSA